VDTSFADSGTQGPESHNFNSNVGDSSEATTDELCKNYQQGWVLVLSRIFPKSCLETGKDNISERISQKLTPKSTCSQSLVHCRPIVEEWLPEHDIFNSTYFCEVIITHLTSGIFPDQGIWRKQRVYVHLDNVRSHNSKDQCNASRTKSSKDCSIQHIHQILHRVTFILLALWSNVCKLARVAHSKNYKRIHTRFCLYRTTELAGQCELGWRICR
jgi:hypothetical protein